MSQTMIPTAITPAILDTILGHLAPHFLASAGDDLPTARHAASHMLAAYEAETEEELRLAAKIVSFGFHALEALSEAAAADLPLTKKLRLRGSAVSLSRESHKAQRQLDRLQRARLTTASQLQPQIPQAPARAQAHAQAEPQPEPQEAASPPPVEATDAEPVRSGLMEFARGAIQAGTAKTGVQTWTQSRQQRRAAARLAKEIRRTNKAGQGRHADVAQGAL